MNLRSALLGCVVALLSACHQDPSGTVAAATPVHSRPAAAQRGPTPAELTAGMVEAVGLSKSAPVDVKFDLPQKPVVGVPLDITLAIMPQVAADPAILEVTGSDALVLAAGGGPIVIPAVEPTQVYRHNVQVTPMAEGVQLLALNVSLKHDDLTETRQFSVPLVVAPKER